VAVTYWFMSRRGLAFALVEAEVAGLRGLLRSRGFWLLAAPFFVCGLTTTGFVDTHLIPLAQDRGISNATADLAVALLAAANVTGILASGPLADRVDNRRLLAAMYLTRGASFVLLLLLADAGALLAFALLFGLVDFAVVAPTQWLAAPCRGSPTTRPARTTTCWWSRRSSSPSRR
jgi:predicted MFS family arabinose efflux permease